MDTDQPFLRGLNFEGEEQWVHGAVGQEPDGQGQRWALQSGAVDTTTISNLSHSLSPTLDTPIPVPSTPIPNTPSLSTISRRRASLADPDSPPLVPPSPAFPLFNPLSPHTDASLHLQQARESVATIAAASGRRGSFTAGGGASSVPSLAAKRLVNPAGAPPPAPSSAYRTSQTFTRSALALPPDLVKTEPRRSILPSGAPLLSSTASSKPYSATSWLRYLTLPSRRMQKTVRVWIVAAIALFAFTRLLDVVAPASTYRRAMHEMRFSDQLSAVGAVEQLPPTFAKFMDRIAKSSGWLAGRTQEDATAPALAPAPFAALQTPVQVQGGGARVQEEQRLELVQTGWKLTDDEQRRSETELVLTPAELENMRMNRREKLWGPPDEDMWINTLKPAKGALHEATIIFLPGMGEKSSESFLPVHLHKRFPTARWVLPQSNDRFVTALNGTYPAWFDIQDFPYDPYTDRDYDSLFSAVRSINRMIAEERTLLIRGLRKRGGGMGERSTGPKLGEGYATSIGPEKPMPVDIEFGTQEEKEWATSRIILTGFSQGGVVALLTALTHPLHLGGLVCFSSFLPLREDLAKLMVDLNRKDLPIFWGHGIADPFLLFTDALTSISLLQPAAVPTYANPKAIPDRTYLDHPSYRLNMTRVTFEGYTGLEHTFSFDQLNSVGDFLDEVLPKGTQRGVRGGQRLGPPPPSLKGVSGPVIVEIEPEGGKDVEVEGRVEEAEVIEQAMRRRWR